MNAVHSIPIDPGHTRQPNPRLKGVIGTCVFAVVITVVLLAILVFRVPKFSLIYEDFDARLPAATLMVIHATDLFQSAAGQVLAVGILAVAVGFAFLMHWAVGRLWAVVILLVCFGALTAAVMMALFLPMQAIVESMS